MWLFGAIGETQNWVQPVFRFILDDQYVSTMVAEFRNETVYNKLFGHFYNLDPSYHTLVVENINENATLFLDYYLIEPIPQDELPASAGNLLTGGEPVSTSISENPMLSMNSSGGTAVGTIVGAVIGGILGTVLIAAVAFVLWRKRRSSKPYYYQSATVYEVLSGGVY
jgi:hypothetical protein